MLQKSLKQLTDQRASKHSVFIISALSMEHGGELMWLVWFCVVNLSERQSSINFIYTHGGAHVVLVYG